MCECTCIICGKSFKNIYPGAHFCSEECKKEGKRRNRRRSYEREKAAAVANKGQKKSAGISMQDVLDYMRENDCQYVEAITKLEEQRYGL